MASPKVLRNPPIVQTVTFAVSGCPRIAMSKAMPDKILLRPTLVTVEKRTRGVRFKVTGVTQSGAIRSRYFNSHGYANNLPAPAWLQILWEGVKDELGI